MTKHKTTNRPTIIKILDLVEVCSSDEIKRILSMVSQDQVKISSIL